MGLLKERIRLEVIGERKGLKVDLLGLGVGKVMRKVSRDGEVEI